MKICKSLDDLNDLRASLRKRRQTLGLVPTMGALHAGHISLVKAAKADGHAALATIFLNPTQFAAHEDLDAYPQTLEADLQALEDAGTAAAFVPEIPLMYPEGEATRVLVNGPSQNWESADRPHFFEGVATVVTKLLVAAQADAAYFGEKDYQQLQVIRRLATDLLIGTTIIGCPTVRADDGLALSSRNAYLSTQERAIAPQIYEGLIWLRDEILAGRDPETAKQVVKDRLLSAGFASLSYLAYVDAHSLEPLAAPAPQGSGRLLFAGTLGTTRLIDNIAV